MVEVGGDARIVDRAGLAEGHRHDRVGRLHEEERRLAAGEAHLLGMLDIVAGQADDLADGKFLICCGDAGDFHGVVLLITHDK